MSNLSASEMSSIVDADQKRDEVVCLLKLFAVREKDQKLIGMVNFNVDWQSNKTVLKDHEVLSF